MLRTIFEDRSSYDPAFDAVGFVTLSLECNPGQIGSVTAFLRGVADQAGVYHVVVDSSVFEPAPKPEAVLMILEPESPAEVEQAVGEAHGEQTIQPEHQQPETAELGPGGETAPSGAAPAGDAGADGELGRPAGEIGTGALGGREESKDLSEVRGPVAPPVADSGPREGTGEEPIVAKE